MLADQALLPREDPLTLADRDETDAELDGHRRTEQESPRLDAADGRDAVVPERPDQAADHRGERPGVAEDLPDVGVATDPPEAFEGQGTCVRHRDRESADGLAVQATGFSFGERRRHLTPYPVHPAAVLPGVRLEDGWRVRAGRRKERRARVEHDGGSDAGRRT
ncbi:hypothetical protein GCM10009646_88950 [Streptomyces aureus]